MMRTLLQDTTALRENQAQTANLRAELERVQGVIDQTEGSIRELEAGCGKPDELTTAEEAIRAALAEKALDPGKADEKAIERLRASESKAREAWAVKKTAAEGTIRELRLAAEGLAPKAAALRAQVEDLEGQVPAILFRTIANEGNALASEYEQTADNLAALLARLRVLDELARHVAKRKLGHTTAPAEIAPRELLMDARLPLLQVWPKAHRDGCADDPKWQHTGTSIERLSGKARDALSARLVELGVIVD